MPRLLRLLRLPFWLFPWKLLIVNLLLAESVTLNEVIYACLWTNPEVLPALAAVCFIWLAMPYCLFQLDFLASILCGYKQIELYWIQLRTTPNSLVYRLYLDKTGSLAFLAFHIMLNYSFSIHLLISLIATNLSMQLSIYVINGILKWLMTLTLFNRVRCTFRLISGW